MGLSRMCYMRTPDDTEGGIKQTLSLVKRLCVLQTKNMMQQSAADMGSVRSSKSAHAVHSLIVDDLRIAFTTRNRATVLAIFDGLNKNRILRRNISSDALRQLHFDETQRAK